MHAHFSPEEQRLYDRLTPLFSAEAIKKFPELSCVPAGMTEEIQASPYFCLETTQAVGGLISKGGDQARQELGSRKLFEEVHLSGVHQTVHAPSNITRGVYPIALFGTTIAILDTGPLKIGDLSSEDTKALVRSTGLSKGVIQKALRPIPSLTAKQVGRVFNLYRNLSLQYEKGILGLVQNSNLRQEVKEQPSDPIGLLGRQLSSHVNGLLSVILGYTSVSSSISELPEEVLQALEQIGLTASKARQLTEELFSFAGAGEAETNENDLHAAIQNIVSLVEDQRSTRVSISTQLKAEKFRVILPSSTTNQLIFLLCMLALEQLPDGGDLRFSTENQMHQNGGTSIRLSIADAKAEPFDEMAVQLTQGLSAFGPIEDDTKKLRLSGLHQLVEAHGGAIRVHRETGTMVTFEVEFPISSNAPIDVPFDLPPKLASRIWVVDDDMIFRKLTAEILQGEGNDVEEFIDGIAMQKAWKSSPQKPQLIVMDFSMPDFNGAEMREWINDHGGSAIPMILVSGLSPSLPSIEKTVCLPKTYFLQKPFTERELNDIACVCMGETLMG